VRAPYLGARSLRSEVPGQRGRLPDRGGSGQGFFARMAGTGCRLSGLPPAAFDPHPCRAASPASRMRRHCKRRPEQSLLRLTRAGGKRRGSVSKGPNDTKPPKARVKLSRKEAHLRPEGASVPCRWGAGDTCQATFHPPRACRPRPTSPDCVRTRRLPPNRRRIFLFARAGFWRGHPLTNKICDLAALRPRFCILSHQGRGEDAALSPIRPLPLVGEEAISAS